VSEFDELKQIDELKALRRIEPSWKTSKLEPFLGPPDSDVKVPTWSKTKIEPTPTQGGGTGGAAVGTPVRFVAGVVVGSSFVPKIVNTDGTTEDIP
jgi:hypothetical protein